MAGSAASAWPISFLWSTAAAAAAAQNQAPAPGNQDVSLLCRRSHVWLRWILLGLMFGRFKTKLFSFRTQIEQIMLSLLAEHQIYRLSFSNVTICCFSLAFLRKEIFGLSNNKWSLNLIFSATVKKVDWIGFGCLAFQNHLDHNLL